MNDHGDVPLPIMGHGGMFTIVYVEPKDPNAPWRHPKQDELDLVRDNNSNGKSKQ